MAIIRNNWGLIRLKASNALVFCRFCVHVTAATLPLSAILLLLAQCFDLELT